MTNEAFSRVKMNTPMRDKRSEIENPDALRFEYVLGDGARAAYVSKEREPRV